MRRLKSSIYENALLMHIQNIYVIDTDILHIYTYMYMFTVHTCIILYAHIQYIHSITYLDRSKNILNKLNICTYVYIYTWAYTLIQLNANRTGTYALTI